MSKRNKKQAKRKKEDQASGYIRKAHAKGLVTPPPRQSRYTQGKENTKPGS
jgi:hypothetical protein